MPAIPTTWEAEMRTIAVQLAKSETPSQPIS